MSAENDVALDALRAELYNSLRFHLGDRHYRPRRVQALAAIGMLRALDALRRERELLRAEVTAVDTVGVYEDCGCSHELTQAYWDATRAREAFDAEHDRKRGGRGE